MKDYLLSPEGRINRSKYWLAALIYLVVIGVASVLMGVLWGVIPGEVIDGSYSVSGINAVPYIIIGFVTFGFLVWSGICVGIKRCHDRDRSGWFLLVCLIPFIGGLWLMIELYFLRGTVGPNRFGADPLDPVLAA